MISTDLRKPERADHGADAPASAESAANERAGAVEFSDRSLEVLSILNALFDEVQPADNQSGRG